MSTLFAVRCGVEAIEFHEGAKLKTLTLSVASVLAMVGSADAAQTNIGELNLKLSGYATLVGAGIDQTNMDGLDSIAGAIDTSFVGAAWIDDDDLEFGAVIALDIDYATNFDTSLNDEGDSTVLNEAWIYMDSPYGRLQVGQEDGAARVLGLRPPTVSGSVHVDDPEVYLLGYPCNLFCSSSPQHPGSFFNPNGMQLRSDIHSSDVWLKIAYYSPRIEGFRLGVSYTPDASRNLGDFFDHGGERNEQSNVMDFALNWIGTVGEVDIAASVGYVMGEIENNDSPFLFDDMHDWGAGLNLGWREWSAGVSYRRTNVAGGGPEVHGNFASNVLRDDETDVWSAGVKYETGPWAFGLNYITQTEELAFSNQTQDGKGFEAAIGYTLNEHVRFTGGYQRFEFDGPQGQCVTDSVFQCDTMDANVGFVESKFSF